MNILTSTMSIESWGKALSRQPMGTKFGIVFLVACLQVINIHLSPSLYLSQFLLVATSLAGGMIEPQKGFWLAFFQMGVLWLGHVAYEAFGWYQTVPQETTFATYTGWFSTLAGSALGAFIRRL